MSIFQSIILGIVQGLTEFLPISSSGHLVIIPYLLKWDLDPQLVFSFDVLVQMGTLVAVLIFYRVKLIEITQAFINGIVKRKPFGDNNSVLGWYLLLATIPAVVVGLLVNGLVEKTFNSPLMVGFFLFVTAGLLILGEILGKHKKDLDQINNKDALWIGFSQVLSIFPGVSRSGATITGGLLCGLERKDAADFSFLMSIPVMIGAGVFSLANLLETPGLFAYIPQLLIGFVVAGVVGYISIAWLLNFIKRQSFKWFALYCVVLGILVLGIGYVR
jgi:undecaprenyl-diphosphatase